MGWRKRYEIVLDTSVLSFEVTKTAPCEDCSGKRDCPLHSHFLKRIPRLGESVGKTFANGPHLDLYRQRGAKPRKLGTEYRLQCTRGNGHLIMKVR